MFNPYNVPDDGDIYIIDSNDRIHQRMEEYKQELIRKKERQIQQKIENFLEGLEYDEEGKPVIPVDEEGNYIIPRDDEGIPLVNIDEEGNLMLEPPEAETDGSDFSEDNTEELSLEPQEIIENANIQAEQILADANARVGEILEQARQEGLNNGYEEGFAQASQELEGQRQQIEIERQNMLAEISKAKESMEEDLVDVICDVVERAFKIQFGDCKDIILHLVENTMMSAGSSKTFIIRVSEKNHGFLMDNKESLLARLGSDCILDIISDPLLEEDSCLIEADGGVFNCGLDTQLSMLLKDLRILSKN